jgi:hypothetical protein
MPPEPPIAMDVESDHSASDVEIIEMPMRKPAPISRASATPAKKPCPGIDIQLPEGQSVHSTYPFGLHDILGDPWDYAVTRGRLVLHASACKKKVKADSTSACSACTNLRDNDSNLAGILQRFETGVHENSRLAFHGVGGLINIVRRKTGEVRALRLRKLNDAQKLASKAVAIDHLKQWVMAVGSGKVERVDRLVRVNLAQKGGISNLLRLYDRAAKGVYHPRSYTEEDDLRGIIKPLIVSSGPPKISEIEENINNTFAPIIAEIGGSDDGIQTPHQVVMFSTCNDGSEDW